MSAGRFPFEDGCYLLVSIQVDMHDKLAVRLQEDLTDTISRHVSRA
jgi:rsbT antagonist protein RsbS